SLTACARPPQQSPQNVAVAPPSTQTIAPTLPAPSELEQAIPDTIQAVLDRALGDSAFPGAFAVIGTHAGILAQTGIGHLDWAPSPTPDEPSLWDLASLTKVIGMTSAVMQLTEQGRIDLDAPLQR